MPPKFAKLAGFGAFGAIALFVAIFALVAYLSMPSSAGGIDQIEATVAWISVGLAVLAVIGVHVLIGKELLALAKQGEVAGERAAERPVRSAPGTR